MGKTTTAVNVAACIAEAGYPSLLVDIDPQANATVGLGHPKDTRPSIYDVLTGDAQRRRGDRRVDDPGPASAAGRPRPGGRERRAAAAAGLRDAPARRARRRARALRLHAARLPAVARPADGQRARRGRPRDRPGADGVLRARGARRACSTRSRSIQRELNPRLTVAGMLLTMHDGRTRLARDVEREVREHFPSSSSTPSSRATCASGRRRASAAPSSTTTRTAPGRTPTSNSPRRSPAVADRGMGRGLAAILSVSKPPRTAPSRRPSCASCRSS